MGNKRCRFCRYRDSNRKIAEIPCNRCKTDNTRNPFGSEFIEYYYGYCWDRKHLRNYIRAKDHWLNKGLMFKVSWKPVPMEGKDE